MYVLYSPYGTILGDPAAPSSTTSIIGYSIPPAVIIDSNLFAELLKILISDVPLLHHGRQLDGGRRHEQGGGLVEGEEHGEDARRMVGLQFGEYHGDGLGIFVLQVVGQHCLIDVAELVPHGPTRRTFHRVHN